MAMRRLGRKHLKVLRAPPGQGYTARASQVDPGLAQANQSDFGMPRTRSRWWP